MAKKKTSFEIELMKLNMHDLLSRVHQYQSVLREMDKKNEHFKDVKKNFETAKKVYLKRAKTEGRILNDGF